jgi:hypothetical protein
MAPGHEEIGRQHERVLAMVRWCTGRRIWAVVMLLGLGVSACGGSSKPSASSGATNSTVNQQTHLAQGETSGIASQLSTVPGYRYVDPPTAEVKRELEILKQQLAERGAPSDLIRAASFHGIVADDNSQNTARTSAGTMESGFLQLREFSPPPPYGIDVAQMGSAGLKQLAAFNVGDTKVVAFEDPAASRDSRYVLMWIRHGVWGAIDGATRDVLERWVRAYLSIPEHQPNENDLLANALVKVPGTAYVNFWDDSTEAVSRELFDGAHASSIHSVVSADGSFGTLLLGTADPGVTAQSLAAVLKNQLGSSQPAIIGGQAVQKATDNSGRTGYTWIRNGIAGAFLSNSPKAAEAFLKQYFQT